MTTFHIVRREILSRRWPFFMCHFDFEAQTPLILKLEIADWTQNLMGSDCESSPEGLVAYLPPGQDKGLVFLPKYLRVLFTPIFKVS